MVNTNFFNGCLAYDGYMNIFLSDYYNKVIHAFLVNGQYNCQLLSSLNINKIPYKLAVDKECPLMYVGQGISVVEVFILKYGNGDD